MQYFKKITLSILCIGASVGLSACLPDGSGVKENAKHELISQQAGGYAAMLSSSATSREAALLISSSWLDGSMSPGLLGTSQDGNVAHAYCHDTSGSNDNHMIISWLTPKDDNDRFIASGIGTEGGVAIVQELAKNNSAHTIGVFTGGEIRLRGPRQSGSTELALPAGGCNGGSLGIPDGAPVFVAENLVRTDSSTLDTASYEYKTSACPGNQVGLITQRREVKTDINGNSSATKWTDYDSTCGGMESAREVAITSTKGTITGAAGLLNDGASVVRNALASLNSKTSAGSAVKCSTVKAAEDVLDDDGKVIHKKGSEIAGNCDEAAKIDLTQLKALGKAQITDTVLSSKKEERECGAGDTSTKHNAGSYGGVTGKVDIIRNPDGSLGWTGKIKYIQNLYKATVNNTGDSDDDYKNTAQWGDWEGDKLNCKRNERLTISCARVPKFNKYFNNPYQITNDSGMIFTRTNVIDGFANEQTMVPNDPLPADKGWAMETPSCAWDEVYNFGCPAGFNGGTGTYKRAIHATRTFGDVNVGDWKSVRQLTCTRTTTTGGCNSTTTTTTITYRFPWDSRESVASFTNDNCGGGDGGSGDPLIIDLGGDGLDLLNMDEGIHMDIDEDGNADITSWAGSEEGFLVYDRNGDGMINDHSEMFGNAEIGGFDHLAQYDSNDDGVMDSNDDLFADLQIWVDANSDGVSQADEIRGLGDHGIKEIGLDFEAMNEEVGDNTITGKGWVKTVTDTVLDAFDVVFNFLTGLFD